MLLKKNLTDCLTIYKRDHNYLLTIQTNYKKWCKKLELQSITECIEENKLFSEFSNNISDVIHALKIMSEIVEIQTVSARGWTRLIIEKVTTAEMKWGRIFLTDLLSVSEKALTNYQFEEILETNLEFVKSYINVYFKRLISKPFVLKAEKSGLLVDIVEYFAKTYKEDLSGNVLDLVEHVSIFLTL